MLSDLTWPTWKLSAIGHNLRIHCAQNMIRFSHATHSFVGRLNAWRNAWCQPTASRVDVSDGHWTQHEIHIVSILISFRPRVSRRLLQPLLLLHRMLIYLLHIRAKCRRSPRKFILYHVMSVVCISVNHIRPRLVLFAQIYSQSLDSMLG